MSKSISLCVREQLNTGMLGQFIQCPPHTLRRRHSYGGMRHEPISLPSVVLSPSPVPSATEHLDGDCVPAGY